MLAALVLLPPATAVRSTLGTSHASATTNMALGVDSSFNSVDTLNGGSLSGELEADLVDEDQYKQYHQITSGDGKSTVATYAYANEPGSWEYKYAESFTKNSATIWETVKATDVTDILFGGFAYNQKDYAAVQVWNLADVEIGAIN